MYTFIYTFTKWSRNERSIEKFNWNVWHSIVRLFCSFVQLAQFSYAWKMIFLFGGKVFNSFVECLMKSIKAWARHQRQWVTKSFYIFSHLQTVNWPNAWEYHTFIIIIIILIGNFFSLLFRLCVMRKIFPLWAYKNSSEQKITITYAIRVKRKLKWCLSVQQNEKKKKKDKNNPGRECKNCW